MSTEKLTLKTMVGTVEVEVLSKHEIDLDVSDVPTLIAPGSGQHSLEIWIVRVEGEIRPFVMLDGADQHLLHKAPSDVEVVVTAPDPEFGRLIAVETEDCVISYGTGLSGFAEIEDMIKEMLPRYPHASSKIVARVEVDYPSGTGNYAVRRFELDELRGKSPEELDKLEADTIAALLAEAKARQ